MRGGQLGQWWFISQAQLFILLLFHPLSGFLCCNPSYFSPGQVKVFVPTSGLFSTVSQECLLSAAISHYGFNVILFLLLLKSRHCLRPSSQFLFFQWTIHLSSASLQWTCSSQIDCIGAICGSECLHFSFVAIWIESSGLWLFHLHVYNGNGFNQHSLPGQMTLG